MDRGFRFIPADSTVYSTWAHTKSSKLEETSWLLAGYVLDEFRIDDDLSPDEMAALKRVIRYEKALLHGVRQGKCKTQMSPAKWLAFAQGRGLSVPSELVKFFPNSINILDHCTDLANELAKLRKESDARKLNSSQSPGITSDKEPSPKSKASMLGTIAALARIAYKREIDHPFKAAASLCSDFAKLGINAPVEERTLAEYIKSGNKRLGIKKP